MDGGEKMNSSAMALNHSTTTFPKTKETVIYWHRKFLGLPVPENFSKTDSDFLNSIRNNLNVFLENWNSGKVSQKTKKKEAELPNGNFQDTSWALALVLFGTIVLFTIKLTEVKDLRNKCCYYKTGICWL